MSTVYGYVYISAGVCRHQRKWKVVSNVDRSSGCLEYTRFSAWLLQVVNC